jgi:hypothetical protein
LAVLKARELYHALIFATIKKSIGAARLIGALSPKLEAVICVNAAELWASSALGRAWFSARLPLA